MAMEINNLKLEENAVDEKTMEEKAREIRNQYYRDWRKKNPDKVRQYNQKRWLKKAQKELESQTPNSLE
jgi:hypothetical protein